MSDLANAFEKICDYLESVEASPGLYANKFLGFKLQEVAALKSEYERLLGVEEESRRKVPKNNDFGLWHQA